MLYHLLYPLAEDFTIFNLFRYLTFRSGGAVITALIISFFIGPDLIKWLKKKQKEGQPIREDGPEGHFKKAGTPTMGGLMILISAGISVLLWSDLTNPYVWIVAGVILSFGMIGLADDYAKLTKRSHQGISGKIRVTAGIYNCCVGGIGLRTFHCTGNGNGSVYSFYERLFIAIRICLYSVCDAGDCGSVERCELNRWS